MDNFQLYYIKDCERMTLNKTSSNHQRFFSNKKTQKNYKKMFFVHGYMFFLKHKTNDE